MDHAAAAGRDDPAAALVERLQRPRRRVADLDHDAAAGGVEEAQDAVADPQLDHLDPEPVGHPRQARDDLAGLVGLELRLGPGVEQHAVPLQAGAAAAPRLVGAHRLERLARDALEVGQVDDPAGVVAHRREVADLGDGDEALVALVVARLGVEEVDVGGGREALEREVLEPPQVHALRHQRMQAAQVAVLLEGAALPAGEARHGDRVPLGR